MGGAHVLARVGGYRPMDFQAMTWKDGVGVTLALLAAIAIMFVVCCAIFVLVAD